MALFFVFFYPVLIVSLMLICSKVFHTFNTRSCTSKRKLYGKTAIVTGPSSGMGLEVARDLAGRGARLIMAGLDDDMMKRAIVDIQTTTGSNNIVVKYVDMSSLDSIRAFCKDVINTEPRLDILVNNAGVAAMPRKIITKDNLEFQMSVNYFGPFLLTNLLAGLMKKSAPSRIVNIGSSTHKVLSKLDLDNLNSERTYNTWEVYPKSKLALTMFTKEFARRMGSADVSCNVLNPGGTYTGIIQNTNVLVKFILHIGMYLFCKTAAKGAQTAIHVAVAEEAENVTGQYFVECRVDSASQVAKDPIQGKKLWELSETMTGLRPEEKYL